MKLLFESELSGLGNWTNRHDEFPTMRGQTRCRRNRKVGEDP